MKIVDNFSKQRDVASVLGVFAKAPVPGQVKTRLCPPLLPEQAAELYRVSLDETIRRFSDQSFDLMIFYAGAEAFFVENYPRHVKQPQKGEDLGARMANALQSLLQAGYSQAVLIGSDSPDLPLTSVEQAFTGLQGSDVVVAPAADGGYVLIGESVHYPGLFDAMPWSQGDLMHATRGFLTEQQIAWQQLPVWEDVDDLYSLERFLRRSPQSETAAHTRKFLASSINRSSIVNSL